MRQCVSALSILALLVCAAVATGQSSIGPVLFQPGPEV